MIRPRERKKGDGKPPDQDAEKIPAPEVGFIYRINKKELPGREGKRSAKGFDFVMVSKIIPAEESPGGKALMDLKRWSPSKKKWVRDYSYRRISIENFLIKNNANNFTIAFRSPQEFYDDQNVPIKDRPKEPVQPSGEPESSPRQADAQEELILGPENKAEAEPAAENPVANVGDFFQWKILNSDKFDLPWEVTRIYDDPEKGKMAEIYIGTRGGKVRSISLTDIERGVASSEIKITPASEGKPDSSLPGEREREPEPEMESYSARQIEDVIRNLLVSNDKVKKIDKLEIKGATGVMKLRIEMSVKTPPLVSGEVAIDAELKNSNKGIIISNYNIEAGSLVKSVLERELVPRLAQVSTILSKYIEEKSGKKVAKIEINDTGDLVATFDSQVSASTERKTIPPAALEGVEPPASDPVPEPRREPPAPDPSSDPLEERKELTPEQKKRAELGERLGLSPEQLAEREQLEALADRTRAEYVRSLYEHEQSMARVLSVLNLKRKVDPEAQYKTDYDQALQSLQQFDVKSLQEKIARSPKDEKNDASVQSYLERYMRLEAIALWSEQQEIRVAHKEAHLDKMSGLSKTILEKAGKLVEGYQKLSWKQKIALGGALFTGHMGLALVSGPAAVGMASLWLVTKLVTGAAAYKSTSKMAEAGVQWTGDKLGGRKDKKEVAKIGELFRGDLEGGEKYFDKLNEVASRHAQQSDKKLRSYERRSVLTKAASIGLIFGAPFARYFGDIMGSAPESVSVSAPGETSTVDPGEVLSPSENTSVPASENPQSPPSVNPEGNTAAPAAPPQAPEAPASGAATPTPEVAPGAPALESATVTSSDSARGLWGIIANQLPDEMTETERNRVTGAVENLIRTKLEGLTDAQIQERYGFSSRDINLIRPGEVIKLNELVSQTELQQIIDGREIAAPEAPSAPLPTEGAEAGVAPESNAAGGENGVTAEAREAQGYINSNTIGFESRPLTAEEQYWQNVRNVQGNAVGPYYTYDDGPAPGGGEISDQGVPETRSAPGTYTAEMGDYRQLLRDPAFEGRNIPVLQRESVALLNEELWDIDNTEFGPDHRFTNWTMQTVERQYQGRPIQELLAFDTNQYDYDPRPEYRQREFELRTGRGIYLDPINPEPTLSSPPDAYAIATMDQIRTEYRHNISGMAEAAIRTFGSAALPQNTLEHQETVREYMTRIATLYTRARLENPNFRLNF